MSNLSGLPSFIPGSPSYPSVTNTNLEVSQYPMVYTTDGPLPTANGIAFTTTGLTFDPTQVDGGLVTKLVAGSGITLSPVEGTGEVTISASSTGGVTQIIAGTNITVDPAGGTGAVTVNATVPSGPIQTITGTIPATNVATPIFTFSPPDGSADVYRVFVGASAGNKRIETFDVSMGYVGQNPLFGAPVGANTITQGLNWTNPIAGDNPPNLTLTVTASGTSVTLNGTAANTLSGSFTFTAQVFQLG